MHHAVAGEPVVGGRVGRLDRVRPVAEVAAVQLVGERAGDGQVERRDLLVDRGVVPVEVAVRADFGGRGHEVQFITGMHGRRRFGVTLLHDAGMYRAAVPRTADPEVRAALTDAAARLLGEEGPAAMTTRRLATEAGTTTTAVYTHFGGKEDLVRAIVWEGFDRLTAHLSAFAGPPTPWPI